MKNFYKNYQLIDIQVGTTLGHGSLKNTLQKGKKRRINRERYASLNKKKNVARLVKRIKREISIRQQELKSSARPLKTTGLRGSRYYTKS